MAAVADALRVGAAQHVDDVAHAEAVVEAVHARQRLLGVDRGVVGLRRVEADVAVAAVVAQVFAEVAEQHAAAAGGGLGVAHHAVELVQLDAHVIGGVGTGRDAALDEAARDGCVAEAEEQEGLGGQAVAPRPAGLLVVALDVLGQVVVHHEAHVALVDAHAEGDGGDHHGGLVAGEGVLHRGALLGRHAGVVGGGRHAGRRKRAATSSVRLRLRQ